jgi:hypothetical protein
MFTLPDDRAALTIEDLKALLTEATNEQIRLAKIDDAEITDAEIDELEAVSTAADTLNGEIAAAEAAVQARADRLAAAKAKVPNPEAEKEGDEPADATEEEAEEIEIVVPDDASELIESEEIVTAAGKAVSRVARKAPAVIIVDEPEVEPTAPYTLVAAANVPGYTTGQDLVDYDEVAKAFVARSRGFGQRSSNAGEFVGRRTMASGANRYGVARIQKAENEFSVNASMTLDQQMAVIDEAAKEARLPGGSLVAAGGWCAPSETMYDFCSFETVSGLVSIPEINVSRGGINFSKGPDYATLAAAIGFQQTETEAEAGTEKDCYAVACPPFSEIRLDAIGFCITAGILTEVAYPELVRRVLEIAAVAHAHKVNKYVIDKMVAVAGAAINYAEIGASTSDLLDAIAIQATWFRYAYSLAPEATLEVVLPVWAKEVVRADLSRRTGVDMLAVSDSQIQSYFGVRNVAVQWVYDWQPFDNTATTSGTKFPTSVEALIYPAGTFVKGGTPVIDLDTVYDTAGLTTNTYTAAFFEEGILVANRCATARRVAIALDVKGGSGFPTVGAGAGVTFASA